ncbi:unnamed protein product [Allacma fusca]|uniref:Calcineurin-like phosphoesterase domain-containing protein n=1 Tax=Allacma fusca TaxID=39272 RepID=A0A8J2LLK2_9HEXA|nr:unnamed protein product [Allacma fusca]
MRISKLTLSLLILIIMLSMFAARISNLISISYDYASEDDQVIPRPYDPSLVLDDENKHLMWFVQISDIHLSIFHDSGRISDFNDFCNVTLDIIQPTVVLASGDLADAKAIDSMGSRQFIQEWHFYQDILQKNNVEKKTMWLDIRGNHDNFNVPSIMEEKSHFHQFSIQGKRHLRSYMYRVTKDQQTYSFIGVDACLDPGPRRPFNFIGLLKSEEYQTLENFERESRDSNGTVWFGHYPTSCIISPDPGIRNLMKNGVAYMCGHLHTLAGTVPKMYTLHRTGTLELELGDWKDNRL